MQCRLLLTQCYLLKTITAAKSAPSFVVEIKDKRALEGETVQFECQFSGTPMPGIFPIPSTSSSIC